MCSSCFRGVCFFSMVYLCTGHRNFSVFSHDKPVLLKSAWPDFGLLSDPFFLYPPFTPLKEKIMNIIRNFL